MITLTASALSADAFAPFGQVLSAASAARQFTINGGNTERFHDLAELSAGADGRLIVSLFRGQPRALPFAVSMLERHPLGSQAFLPLGERPYLVVVAPPGAPPSPASVRAFLAAPGQGVNYAPGVWHHPPDTAVRPAARKPGCPAGGAPACSPQTAARAAGRETG
jgi:ureidoglycolate lyase